MKKPLTKLCLAATLLSAPLASAETQDFGLGTGRDGALKVDSPTRINRYAEVTAALAAGDTKLPVASTNGFAAGELVMVLQPAGAASRPGVDQDAPSYFQGGGAGCAASGTSTPLLGLLLLVLSAMGSRRQ